jgi:hypothetical protein
MAELPEDYALQSNQNDENNYPNANVELINKNRTGYQLAKKQATSDILFRSFEMKWSKISDIILSRLECLQTYLLKNPCVQRPKELRLTKLEMTVLINTIVDQLRIIDTFIPASTMETVARNILLKFPCLEMYDDDGFTDGLSYIVIKHKLINRNSYLNRLKTSASLKTPPAKKIRNIRAGTLKNYWLNSCSECSKEVWSKLRRNEPNLLTNEFLEISQAYIRNLIDSTQDLKALFVEVPVLRRRKLLFYHFQKATGVEIDTLKKYFSMKRAKIVEYSIFIQAHIKISDSSSDLEIFNFLASMVGEKLDDLVLKKEVSVLFHNIKEHGIKQQQCY